MTLLLHINNNVDEFGNEGQIEYIDIEGDMYKNKKRVDNIIESLINSNKIKFENNTFVITDIGIQSIEESMKTLLETK